MKSVYCFPHAGFFLDLSFDPTEGAICSSEISVDFPETTLAKYSSRGISLFQYCPLVYTDAA